MRGGGGKCNFNLAQVAAFVGLLSQDKVLGWWNLTGFPIGQKKISSPQLIASTKRAAEGF